MSPFSNAPRLAIAFAFLCPGALEAQQIVLGPSLIRRGPANYVYEIVFDQDVTPRIQYKRDIPGAGTTIQVPAKADKRHEFLIPTDTVYRFRIFYPSSGGEASTYEFRTEPAIIPATARLQTPSVSDGNLLTIPMQSSGVGSVEVVVNPGPSETRTRLPRTDGPDPLVMRLPYDPIRPTTPIIVHVAATAYGNDQTAVATLPATAVQSRSPIAVPLLLAPASATSTVTGATVTSTITNPGPARVPYRLSLSRNGFTRTEQGECDGTTCIASMNNLEPGVDYQYTLEVATTTAGPYTKVTGQIKTVARPQLSKSARLSIPLNSDGNRLTGPISLEIETTGPSRVRLGHRQAGSNVESLTDMPTNAADKHTIALANILELVRINPRVFQSQLSVYIFDTDGTLSQTVPVFLEGSFLEVGKRPVLEKAQATFTEFVDQYGPALKKTLTVVTTLAAAL
jgi:hypothetical protein